MTAVTAFGRKKFGAQIRISLADLSMKTLIKNGIILIIKSLYSKNVVPKNKA